MWRVCCRMLWRISKRLLQCYSRRVAPGKRTNQKLGGPEAENIAGMGMVTSPINSPMVIRQSKVRSQARVHPDERSGTLRDRAGGSLYTSREHVSPRGCSELHRAVGSCRTRIDESNALNGFVLWISYCFTDFLLERCSLSIWFYFLNFGLLEIYPRWNLKR